jgi:hypothetical protein
MPISRNLDGFSALPASHPLANLDLGNQFKWAAFWEDFTAYDITQLIGGHPWTLTQTNCVDTIVGSTGVLALTLGGADNDAGQMQLAESPFTPSSTKRLFFQARFNLTLASGGTVAANEMFVGLATEQTTTNFMNAGGTALAVDNCLGFVKYDAGASMFAVGRVSDVESTTSGVLTPTDGTWFTVSIYYDGTDAYFYRSSNADGSGAILVATLTSDVVAVLNPTLFIKAGEAKANVLNVDYIGVWLER